MSSEEPSDVDLVGDMLRDEGYKSVVDRDENVVQSGANGLKFVVVIFPESLQFHCSITLPDGAQVPYSELNRVNGAYRFIRMFVDTESNGLAVQNDHFFDVRADGAKEKFSRIVQLFDGSIQNLKEVYLHLQAEIAIAENNEDTTQ